MATPRKDQISSCSGVEKGRKGQEKTMDCEGKAKGARANLSAHEICHSFPMVLSCFNLYDIRVPFTSYWLRIK